MSTWGRTFAGIPDEDYNIVAEAITAISDRSAAGNYKRNPNLGHFQAEYRHLKSLKTGNVQKHANCSACANSGLLSMVVAMDVNLHRQRPLKTYVAIPSPKADVVTTPCSCSRGIEVTGPTFIKVGSQKSDEDRNYTGDQIRKLSTACGYTSAKEADEYRQKCEKFYKAWIEKYPKKPVDQTVGYKGDKNQQVRGFWQEPETKYTPYED
jgi:hypothetical protein